MRRFILILLFAASCRPLDAEEPPAEVTRWLQPQTWQRDVEQPILSLGTDGDFDDRHIFAPAVVHEGARYLLWYSGSRGNPGNRVFRLGLATSVDGNDVIAVDEAVAAAVASVRRGQGPQFVHARTYRLMGHTSTDAAAWRPADELEAAHSREPIARLAQVLTERGVAAESLAAIGAQAADEIAAAREAARAAPWPEPMRAFADVQDAGAVAWPR